MINVDYYLSRAPNFQRHPLGFYYLRDAVDNTVHRRLHVWDDQDTLIQENDRHSHSFEIQSQVLTGRLGSEIYTFVETPDGADDEYQVSYGSTHSRIVATGRRGRLALTSKFETPAGARYNLSAGVVHRITVWQRPCVTLLTTIEKGAPIYVYGNNPSEPPFERRRVNEQELVRITAILQSLTAGMPDK